MSHQDGHKCSLSTCVGPGSESTLHTCSQVGCGRTFHHMCAHLFWKDFNSGYSCPQCDMVNKGVAIPATVPAAAGGGSPGVPRPGGPPGSAGYDSASSSHTGSDADDAEEGHDDVDTGELGNTNPGARAVDPATVLKIRRLRAAVRKTQRAFFAAELMLEQELVAATSSGREVEISSAVDEAQARHIQRVWHQAQQKLEVFVDADPAAHVVVFVQSSDRPLRTSFLVGECAVCVVAPGSYSHASYSQVDLCLPETRRQPRF